MSDHNHPDEDLDALYRGGTPEQPPAALDRRILAAAAARARRRRRAWPLRPLPATGLATAAVLMLAVALVLRQPPEPTAVEMPVRTTAADRTAAAPAPAEPRGADETAKSGRAAPEADLRLEENVATGQRAERRADADREASRERAASATGLLAAFPPAAPVSFRAPGCAEAFPVPAGAELKTVDGGLQITVEDEVYAVRCIDSAWVRQDPQREDQQDSTSDRQGR